MDIENLLEEAIEAYQEPGPTPDEPEKGAAPEAADGKPVDETPEKKEEIEDKLDSIINSKYGGDRNKFVEGLYEQWNSTSKLAKEIKELKEQLVASSTTPDKEVEVSSPQLDWLNKQAAKLDSETKDRNNKLQGIISSYSQLERDIAKAEGELSRAEDLDKERIENKIEHLKDKLSAKKDKFDEYQERLANIELEKEAVSQNINWTKEQLKNERSQQLQKKVDEKEDQRNTVVEFVEAVKEHGIAFRIPKANLSHMANSIRGEIAVYLRSLGDDAPKIDINKAVKERVAAYAKAMGLGAAAPKVTMPGGAAVPPAKAPTSSQQGNDKIPKNAKEAAKMVDDVFAKFGI